MGIAQVNFNVLERTGLLSVNADMCNYQDGGGVLLSSWLRFFNLGIC